jgi:hypothetical protein
MDGWNAHLTRPFLCLQSSLVPSAVSMSKKPGLGFVSCRIQLGGVQFSLAADPLPLMTTLLRCRACLQVVYMPVQPPEVS